MSRQLETAFEKASEAIELDRLGKVQDAIEKYLEAVEILLKITQSNPSLSKYAAKITEYLDRVEALKSIQSPSTPITSHLKSQLQV